MLKQITINKVYRNDSKKDGTKYVDKKGKPFQMVTIMTRGKEGQDVRMSTIDYQNEYAELMDGQTIELDVTKNGEYINFKYPSEVQRLSKRVDELEKRIKDLEQSIIEDSPKAESSPMKDEDYPEFLNDL